MDLPDIANADYCHIQAQAIQGKNHSKERGGLPELRESLERLIRGITPGKFIQGLIDFAKE